MSLLAFKVGIEFGRLEHSIGWMPQSKENGMYGLCGIRAAAALAAALAIGTTWGSIKAMPASGKDLFFHEVYDLPGN